jgi:2-keto-4-pentenoate hydratase
MTSNSEIAEALVAARLSHSRIDTGEFSDAPQTRADCYAIQQAVADRVGPVAGFKTGRGAPGEEPIMAPIFADVARPSGASFRPDELSVIGIELEIGFRINRVLPDPADADFADRLRLCVSPLPAIEVVDTRLADPQAAGTLWQLADNQNNGGLVCGDPLQEWDHLDLATATIELTIGGVLEFSGLHKVPGGDAFDVFCAFASIAGDHCGGLQPGQTVIVGSVMGCHYIEPGRDVHGSIAGLGEVSAGF